MFKSFSTAISDTQGNANITRRLPRRIYTSFVLRERLENNAANESEIVWWLSQLRQNRTMLLLADHRWK